MYISLYDITKENWEYVAFMTTNEDKRPSVVEKYLNGNAYSMLEALYNPELTMKVIVVSEGEKLKGVGFTLYGPVDNDGETVYMIYRFMIDVRFQGQGYGTKAITLIKEEMKKQYHCEEIYVSIVPENERALHLYETAGFASTGIEIGSEEHKEIVYKCQL